jgi:hypothetical protein
MKHHWQQGVGQSGWLGGSLNLVTREEFDALKKDVLEMKADLIKARAEDIKNGEPDCEMESKVALLKKIAEVVGVSLDEVFTKSSGIGK